jgi:hypothetical protein
MLHYELDEKFFVLLLKIGILSCVSTWRPSHVEFGLRCPRELSLCHTNLLTVMNYS